MNVKLTNYTDAKEAIKMESIRRDFVGMRDALFDTWDKVLNKTCDLREAELAVKAAAVICKTVDTEIKIRKFLPTSGETFLLSTSMKHDE